MKKLFVIIFLVIAIIGCDEGQETIQNQYIAKIVGFDLNCSTCILSFPFDSAKIAEKLGISENYYYQTVNLEKNDFTIGQLLLVDVRKAEPSELNACITLYPSFNYENIYVTNFDYYRDFQLNDTILLNYGECLNDYTNQLSICFDSVLTDSRCPENVVCIWAGEAIARFRIMNRQNDPRFLDLYTGTVDTIVNGYKLSFLDLLPYPNTEIPRDIEDYKAKLLIKKLNY